MGTTRDEVVRIVNSRGSEVWATGFAENYAVGNFETKRIDYTIAFCKDRLRWASRSLDFDADYFHTVQQLVAQHGQLSQLNFRDNIWTGPEGGSVRSVDMIWQKATYKVTLSVTPESRTTDGRLRYNRSLFLSFASAAKC